LKKSILFFAVAVFAYALVMGTAGAAVFGSDGGSLLQGTLDGITTAPVSGTSSVDVTTDDIADAFDSYWNIAGGGEAAMTMVFEHGVWQGTNKFGIFDESNFANRVDIFQGSDTPGAQDTISILSNGDVWHNGSFTGVTFGSQTFGFYIDATPNGSKIWYSDTALNADRMDHMYAYQGQGDTIQVASLPSMLWSSDKYMLAFEDVSAAHSDKNYADLVVLVDSVQNVPIPTTLLLFGSGLFGLVGLRRKTYA